MPPLLRSRPKAELLRKLELPRKRQGQELPDLLRTQAAQCRTPALLLLRTPALLLLQTPALLLLQTPALLLLRTPALLLIRTPALLLFRTPALLLLQTPALLLLRSRRILQRAATQEGPARLAFVPTS
jgi:hypothetical protein